MLRNRLVRPRIGVSAPFVRPAVRAPERKEEEVGVTERQTSSRQPAGASPARGEARVPGREAPVRGREAGREAGWNNRPVRSMKRSLQRRHIYPHRERGQGGAEPLKGGRRPRTAPGEPGAGAHEPPSAWGVERSEGCRGNWRGPPRPRACGPGSRPAYNQRTGSGGRPRGSRRGP